MSGRSESQVGSASVASLPSVVAPRMAAMGRQKLYAYFVSNTVIEPSASATFKSAKNRAARERLNPWEVDKSRASALKWICPFSNQKYAAAV